VLIEIETEDRKLGTHIFGNSKSLEPECRIDIPGNATIIPKGSAQGKGSDPSQRIVFVLAFRSGVSSGPVANWLYQKIAGRVTKIRIDQTEIGLSKEQIATTIRDKVGRICP
jgi:hypothetical protein